MAKSGWGERLKARARELALSDAAVARALDLPQRRYSAYVNETREPDFATLGRICRVLRTTPDAILSFGPHETLPTDDAVTARLEAVVRGLRESDRIRALYEPRLRHIMIEAVSQDRDGPLEVARELVQWLSDYED